MFQANSLDSVISNGLARTLRKLRKPKGRLLDQAVILFNCVLFITGTSLKGKNLLPLRGEFCPLRAVPYSMEITFALLGDLP